MLKSDQAPDVGSGDDSRKVNILTSYLICHGCVKFDSVSGVKTKCALLCAGCDRLNFIREVKLFCSLFHFNFLFASLKTIDQLARKPVGKISEFGEFAITVRVLVGL